MIALNNNVPDGPLLVPGITTPYTLIIDPSDPAVRTEGLARLFDVAGNSRLCAWVIPVLLECPAQAATTIVCTPGDDNLLGTAGNDVKFGVGRTTASGAAGGNDIICGGEGNDFVSGDAGEDALFGGPGNHSLAGGLGEDDLFGEAGDDKLAGTDAVILDYLSGGPHIPETRAPPTAVTP